MVFVFIILCTFYQPVIFAQKKTYTVVLDPGHGGKDPGKVAFKKYKEKDIALAIVLKLGELLEKESHINVIYTRKKDVFIDLWERANMANRVDADLFVSIHCNAHSSQASGAETWVLGLNASKQNMEVAKRENEVILLEDNYEEKYQGFDPNSPESLIGLTIENEEYQDQSLQLASIVQNNMVKDLGRKNRMVKQAGFVVLFHSYMPSILIETGFLTNKSEGQYLSSKNGQFAYATSIAKGVKEYLGQIDLNTVVDEIMLEPIEESVNTSIVFKVQIASGKKKIAEKPYNFNGLKEVHRVRVSGAYKYYLGETHNFDEVKEYQQLAQSKGYKDAFIVAFKDGEKISVTEALKSL
ncbi:N-acetylmuramoyl-L-alanine amidase [Urechidicola sp. KH5]